MSITKVNKGQLSTASEDLKSKIDNLNTIIDGLKSTLNNVPKHNKFPGVKSKCSAISSSLGELYTDYNNYQTNINSYVTTLSEIDSEGFDVNAPVPEKETITTPVTNLLATPDTQYRVQKLNTTSRANSVYSYTSGPTGTVVHTNSYYTGNNSSTSIFSSSKLTESDFNVPSGGKYNYARIEKYLENEKGVTVEVPAGLGSIHTYMGWQLVTSRSSTQYKLREAAGMNFDEEGFAKIGDRYVVATTTTFGNVGDYIDVYQEDGTIIKCVIGDIKNQNDEGCTKWGHNNGKCVVEFVVDKNKWYNNGRGNHVNPGTSKCHPEWNQNITKIVNKGNYFDLIKTDAAALDEDPLSNAEVITV